MTLKDNFSVPNEIVVADNNTRTIFGNYGHTFGSVPNWNEVHVEDLFEAYRRYCKGLIIFTFGSEKLYYGRNDGKKNTFKPFDLRVVDTAGGFGVMSTVSTWKLQPFIDYKGVFYLNE